MRRLLAGDSALGYDMANANYVGLDFDAYVAKGGSMPDVVLVRKSFSERRKKRRDRGGTQRAWKLKQLDMEVDDTNGRRNAEAQLEEDRERFYEVTD